MVHIRFTDAMLVLCVRALER